MASITKTPSNTWKAIVRRRGWPTSIKTFRTKRDAVDWARNTEDEIIRGVYINRAPSGYMSIKDALDRYRREVSITKGASTQDRERCRSKILTEKLGKYALATLTSDLVARYRDNRLAAGKSNNTVRLELALLSHLYKIAIQEWGVGLTHNPVANVRKPSPGSGRNRRLLPEEESGLLAAVDQHSNPILGWAVRIALYTAMRQGEILSLYRSQVDLDRHIVRLDKTKNGSARTVPLSPQAVAVFSEAMAHPFHETTDSPLLFPGDPGRDKKRRPYVINRVWAMAVARAGLQDLRFHDLRHEAVSRLVESGLNDQEVAAISGHKSMQMLKRYTHLRAEDLVKKLGLVFSERSDGQATS